MQLSQLTVYPIKSTAGIRLNHAMLYHSGLAFDRRFVLSDPKGKFITARTQPRLLLIQSALIPDGLYLTAPDMPPLTIKYSELLSNYQPVTVWGEGIHAQCNAEKSNRWFSTFLAMECNLLFFGNDSQRQVLSHPEHPVGFADAYPLLLISEASLADLNSRCASEIQMDQLRPNLVVSGCEPYAEDSWKRIRIGTIELELVSPCSRCVLTTVDSATAERNPLKEPLSVLKRYRRGTDGQAYFGQNLIALNEGVLNIHDPVEILETQVPEKYPT